MMDGISQLFFSISKIQLDFYREIDSQDLISEINYKKKQINHLVTDKKLSNLFFDYLTRYYYFASKLIHSNIIADLSDQHSDLNLSMRLKSLASLQNKIEKYYRGKLSGRIPIQKCVNDILGFRIILKQDCSQEPSFIQMCDDHKRNNIIRKYYFKDDSGYRGMHIYFNAQSNLFLPWELQVWYDEDESDNYRSHLKYKQTYFR
ncbi:hypothetical protein M0R79_05475 [Ignavigranum ruoffiae]|uniref:hypothetical protein n=1 Tax=Ignavigranum ruoffiae TaxID=89093 RepID=UPI00205DB149|nr:hypothetical protein [Ignavigranum ruoffiae]UPQ85126.1 hypothetical protein M0R79_05475 [Ignavigranum ruoffiae]